MAGMGEMAGKGKMADKGKMAWGRNGAGEGRRETAGERWQARAGERKGSSKEGRGSNLPLKCVDTHTHKLKASMGTGG